MPEQFRIKDIDASHFKYSRKDMFRLAIGATTMGAIDTGVLAETGTMQNSINLFVTNDPTSPNRPELLDPISISGIGAVGGLVASFPLYGSAEKKTTRQFLFRSIASGAVGAFIAGIYAWFQASNNGKQLQ